MSKKLFDVSIIRIMYFEALRNKKKADEAMEFVKRLAEENDVNLEELE